MAKTNRSVPCTVQEKKLIHKKHDNYFLTVAPNALSKRDESTICTMVHDPAWFRSQYI